MVVHVIKNQGCTDTSLGISDIGLSACFYYIGIDIILWI